MRIRAMVAMAFPAIASSILVGASAALPDLLPPELRWLPTVLAFCAGGLASLALASLDHAASDDEELVVVAAPPPVDAKVSPLPARKISAKHIRMLGISSSHDFFLRFFVGKIEIQS